MSLYEKIEEISIDDKQRVQIEWLFEIGATMAIAFNKQTGVTPNHATFISMFRAYIKVAGDAPAATFDDYMKDYNKRNVTE